MYLLLGDQIRRCRRCYDEMVGRRVYDEVPDVERCLSPVVLSEVCGIFISYGIRCLKAQDLQIFRSISTLKMRR